MLSIAKVLQSFGGYTDTVLWRIYRAFWQLAKKPKRKLAKKPYTQGWNNRTAISHERVDSRFLVLPGSESTITEITEYSYFSLILTTVEFKYKSY